ncbi:MAG: hypothetical protein ABEH56_06915 [Salinirussus sp.]
MTISVELAAGGSGDIVVATVRTWMQDGVWTATVAVGVGRVREPH